MARRPGTTQELKEADGPGRVRSGHDGPVGSYASAEELVELLMRYTPRRGEAGRVAGSLVKRFKGLRGVFEARTDELTCVDGVTEDTAILINLVKALSAEHLKTRVLGRGADDSGDELSDYLTLAFSGERVEKFLAVYLDSAGKVSAVEVLHEGTINQTMVYPRKAIERAFAHKAHSVIFVHNHPSGNATPSDTDRELARVLERAASAVGLEVRDHMIVGKKNCFSSARDGWG